MYPPPYGAILNLLWQKTMAKLHVEVITLVPELWPTLLGQQSGLVGRAFERGHLHLNISDLRDFGHGRHRKVDDTPFGGGPGMVLQVEPLHKTITAARQRTPGPVLLMGPRGRQFTQRLQQCVDALLFIVSMQTDTWCRIASHVLC